MRCLSTLLLAWCFSKPHVLGVNDEASAVHARALQVVSGRRSLTNVLAATTGSPSNVGTGTFSLFVCPFNAGTTVFSSSSGNLARAALTCAQGNFHNGGTPWSVAWSSACQPTFSASFPFDFTASGYCAPVAAPPKKKDWAALERAATAEDAADVPPDGEEALQALFRGIYANADEDTRKAMVKSFVSVGGEGGGVRARAHAHGVRASLQARARVELPRPPRGGVDATAWPAAVPSAVAMSLSAPPPPPPPPALPAATVGRHGPEHRLEGRRAARLCGRQAARGPGVPQVVEDGASASSSSPPRRRRRRGVGQALQTSPTEVN